MVEAVAFVAAVEDRELRCKGCLRRLTTPARVRRLSRHLLGANGTELPCPWHHGLLSVPERDQLDALSRWMKQKAALALVEIECSSAPGKK